MLLVEFQQSKHDVTRLCSAVAIPITLHTLYEVILEGINAGKLLHELAILCHEQETSVTVTTVGQLALTEDFQLLYTIYCYSSVMCALE